MDFWEHEDRIEAMKLPQEEQEQEKRLRKLMEEGKMSPEEYAQLTRRLYNKIKQEVEKVRTLAKTLIHCWFAGNV